MVGQRGDSGEALEEVEGDSFAFEQGAGRPITWRCDRRREVIPVFVQDLKMVTPSRSS